MLVIADHGQAVALAGVMGGAPTEVSSTTTQIAIESAWFLPASVRATSRKLGLKTEASARFERGADVTAPVRALRRALALLEKIGAGQPVGAIVDVYPQPAEPRHVTLRRAPARPAAWATRFPTATSSAYSRHLGFAPARERRGLGRGRSGVPRRRRPRGGPHRGSGPALGLRPDSGHVPAAAEPAAASRRLPSSAIAGCGTCSAAPGCRKP